MDMTHYKDGRIHFRNSKVKELKCLWKSSTDPNEFSQTQVRKEQ